MASGGSHKSQYYVWYLGWKECQGLGGREFTEPIVRELLVQRRHELLPKLTIEIAKKELKVVQMVEKKKKGKIDKVKYPAIPTRDITFATQALYPDEDVVACIYLGYNTRTQCAVHTHVYRCDSPDTAALFVEDITQLILLPDHQKRVRKIEEELFEKEQIMLRPPQRRMDRYGSDEKQSNGAGERFIARQNSSGSGGSERNSDDIGPRFQIGGDELGRSDSYRSSRSNEDSGGPRSPLSPGNPGERMPPVFDDAEGERREAAKSILAPSDVSAEKVQSLADELKARLGSKTKAPLLLPPKDYDTIHRTRGNLLQIENRKCLNKEIVGKSGVYKISSNDSAKGDGDVGDSQNDDETTLVIGQSNNPALRPKQYEPPSPLSYPVVYTSQTRKPFTPGPNTSDLQRQSYFPSKEELPNYLPNPRKESYRNGDESSRIGLGMQPSSEKRPLRKQHSSPEFRKVPDLYRRHPDDSFSPMNRSQEYQAGFYNKDNLSPLGSDVDLSQTVPVGGPRRNSSKNSSTENSRRSSRENMHSPRGDADQADSGFMAPKRGVPKLSRIHSGYY